MNAGGARWSIGRCQAARSARLRDGRRVSSVALCAAALLCALAWAPTSPAGAAPPELLAAPLLGVFQQAELTVGGAATLDLLGCAVAVSGDTMVVGAEQLAGAGAAYVFVRNAGVWTQQAKLLAGDGNADDYFGSTVAISGDTVLVGAYAHSGGGNAGAAYVFTRSGVTWIQQQKLAPSDGASGDDFGRSVGLSGDTAVIGADNHAVSGKGRPGAAYIFSRSGTTWTQVKELNSTDGADGDEFGYAVAVSGSTAVVGAWHTPNGAVLAGAAYIFAGSNWSQQQKLFLLDPVQADEFGLSVAISGDTALVGAQGRDLPSKPNAGQAFVYVRSGTVWSQQAALSAADATSMDSFGCSVALEGDTALVGASLQTVGTASAAGAAYAFTRSAGAWTQAAELTAADGAAGDEAGSAVGLSGATAVVGAPWRAAGGIDSAGTAYAFLLDGTPPVTTVSGVPAGWSKTPVTATLTASDDLTGVAKIEYHLQGATSWQTYAGPFVVGTEGSSTYECRSTDKAGNVETPKSFTVRLDASAPTTTAAGVPAGWSKTPVTVTLTGADALSGVTSTEYRLQGAPSWTTYSAPFQTSAQGSSTYECRSTDKAGNVETPKSFTVRVDASAPTTTASGVPAGWSKSAVMVTLAGADALSGVASIEYRLQGAPAWTTYTAPFSVDTQGSSTYEYRASDAAGNVEAAQTFTLRIDAKGPQTLALAKVKVKKGKSASLRFKVNDLTPTATVTIKIYKHNKLKKTIAVGSLPTNSSQSYKWSCKLAKGSYTWKVYATDLAGNVQTKAGSRTLVVK